MRSGGVTAKAARITWFRSVSPPASCKTLALADFIRVPKPAPRITVVNLSFICSVYVASAHLFAPGARGSGWPGRLQLAQEFEDCGAPYASRYRHRPAGPP